MCKFKEKFYHYTYTEQVFVHTTIKANIMLTVIVCL